jgi:Leucine-rich repeat (LRR) protein
LHPEHIKVLLVADFAELPPWMHRLRNLRMLKAGPTRGLTSLDFLENMPDIMTIDLAYTPSLQKLPACIVNCRNLKRLILQQSSRLERLPAGLTHLPSLSEIRVSTKNLCSKPSILFPPQDVCDRGTRAIKEYLLAHMDKD